MTGSAVLRHATAMVLACEGALIVLLAAGLSAYANSDEDGALNLVLPSWRLLTVMAVGAVLVAGAVGTWLQGCRSGRKAAVATALITLAALANCVILAVTLADSVSVAAAVALLALTLQATDWTLSHRSSARSAASFR